MPGSSCNPCGQYSPGAAAAFALLCALLLVTVQMLGDRNWLAAKIGSGAAVDKLKLHPHGAMAAFGVQDVHAASHWGGLPAAETPEGARSAAAAPAPAAAGLAGLAEKLLGPAKVMNGSLPAAFREDVKGVEVVITRPHGEPKAVVLLFHGCQHSAVDWGYPSPTCSSCLGLPEEVRIVRMVTKAEYAAVAFSSTDKQNRCWDAQWLEQSVDLSAVREAWAVLAARENWEKLPKYALGVSSGASMVLLLALRMQLDGIVPQIMSLPPHMLEGTPSDPVSGKSWGYPPTYFMHMALDHATAQRVSADIAAIKSKQGAWVTEKLLRPRPVTAELLAERIEGVDAAMGAAIVRALSSEGLLNATGFLVEDPRQSVARWQDTLKGVPGLKAIDSLQPEKSPVSEELNLAWARHEIISDHVDEVLEWLDARRRDGSAKLLPQVKPRRRQRLLGRGVGHEAML
ncbi:hypothetical protein CVIRNUC_001044 [Coccomyxa viridis]|uniref:Uncharacterized protein n=1 Tax=Coccomyxa viridis TaxID=1274662 RepID=A0AAV1HTN1_9CHLO|nr:hypothetical protein CVIRNUC_001044 [Coccomyxa viridis]